MDPFITFAAFFSFGYCIADIITNWRSQKQMDEFVKDILKERE